MKKKKSSYIDNRVEETFPQLPRFQIRCLETTTFSFTQSNTILTGSNIYTFNFLLLQFLKHLKLVSELPMDEKFTLFILSFKWHSLKCSEKYLKYSFQHIY